MANTIFERCGGFASVSKLVLAFYDKALDSDVLADYFADVEMARLIDHQTKFFAALMGGPASYTNEHIRRVHATLGIDTAAFEEMSTLLEETLEEFDLADADIEAVMGEIRAREPFIVTRRD